MPHSSGGGSHGGGSHGGSHGSSNHISRSYFPGSRRYRRHYSDGRLDEYIYASRKPTKTTLSSVIIVIVMAAFFLFAGTFGIAGEIPKKLRVKYKDAPVVIDEIEMIEDDRELVRVLNGFCDVTGICPVIITTYDEVWNRNYPDLESYAYDQYVDNYRDEQHFVIVYSLPMEQAMDIYDGNDFVPDYQWEAIQGDETDPIITESYFKRFADRVQDKLEAGDDPGEAFGYAFKKGTDEAANTLTPGNPSYLSHLFISFIPMLIIMAIFVPMIISSVKAYRRDKDAEYEEVPFGEDDVVVGDGNGTAGMSVGAFATTYSKNSNGTHAAVNYDPVKGGSKLSSAIYFAVMIPFFLVGVGILIGGISAYRNDGGSMMSLFMIGFAVLWLIILVSMFMGFFKKIAQIKKKEDEPVNISYPTSEYPQPVMPGQNVKADNTAVNTPAQPADKTEFDPQFFTPSKSTYEDDDEDYKRMKRQGFE